MPKAVLVRWGEEYLPGMSLAELEETYRREPPSKSRDRLQAAVLRKRDKMLAEIAAISRRHPSTIHIIRQERNRLVHHEGDLNPPGRLVFGDYNHYWHERFFQMAKLHRHQDLIAGIDYPEDMCGVGRTPFLTRLTLTTHSWLLNCHRMAKAALLVKRQAP